MRLKNRGRQRMVAGASVSAAVAAAAGWAIMHSASAAPQTVRDLDQTAPTAVRSVEAVNSSPVSGCPAGTAPELRIQRFPDGATTGATTVAAAVQQIDPTISADSIPEETFGPHDGAPVWVDADGKTFVVIALSDGTWFASAAAMAGCGSPPPRS